MSNKEHFEKPEALAALDMIGLPVWVFDVTHHKMWWGNRAALDFWGCETLEDLLEKDYSSDTDTVRERLRDTVQQTPAGESVYDSWTLYPGGQPTPTHQRITPIFIGSDRHDGVLMEVTAIHDGRLDATDLRLLEATHYSPFLVSYFDEDGTMTFQNPKSSEIYGGTGYDHDDDGASPKGLGFVERFENADVGQETLALLIRDGSVSEDYEMRTRASKRWHRVTAKRVRDPASGNDSLLMIEEDVTSLKRAERAVAESATLLRDAVESLGDGFILTDAEERIVLVNSRYKEMYPELAHLIRPGVRFEDLIRAATAIYPMRNIKGTREEWIQERMANFRKTGVRDRQASDGRWLRVSDRRTTEGGIAGSRVDITELREALVAAESASAAKSEFLSSMSHELRTPLHSVLGFAQVLERDKSTPLTDRQERAVGMIKSSGEHLLTLIEGILDLSRIETGKFDVVLEPVPLRPVFDDCMAIAASLAKKNGVTVHDDTQGDELPLVHAEPTRLKQVLLNLLSNAVKYNRSGGDVHLRFEGRDVWSVKISITDTGSGIAKNDFERVFMPFDRLGRESLEIEGTGIGLPLSKKLVELMNGDIGFDSAPGMGSTFWFTLNTSTARTKPLTAIAATAN